MDRLKSVAKGGWQPSGDRQIHRDTWKSDLKGIATGKKHDPYEAARNHESTPLSSLRDPASFAPPPKHSAYYGDAQSPGIASASSQGGLGSPVPAPSRQRQLEQQRQEEEESKPPPQPYRRDTTGLRTDNLPKPPVRRADGQAIVGGSVAPARTSSPSLPPRQAASPALPSRQASKPPPSLPPRMTENPTEHTPAPPPTYGEAQADNGYINQGAVNRLGQAGVSVPGFGIGGAQHSTPPQSPAGAPQGHGGQLRELQQRFSRLDAGSSGAQASPPPTPTSGFAAAAAGKKAPPPPPPKKKAALVGADVRPQSSDGMPPPIPISSKPKPTG